MKYLIAITQTRLVVAQGNSIKDAIIDVQDNPELYGEQSAPNYLDDFIVEGIVSSELSTDPTAISAVEDCYLNKRG